MGIVITSSDRLNLEILQDSHFEDLADLLANERVHKHFPKTLNKEESKQFLNRFMEKQVKDGYSFWAVIRKEDQRFIGLCGLISQEIDNIIELEVGYRFNDVYWGKGYATEAAKACMLYAKEILKSKRIISIIRPINKPSIRVAERNGLLLEKQSIFHGFEVNIYSTLL